MTRASSEGPSRTAIAGGVTLVAVLLATAVWMLAGDATDPGTDERATGGDARALPDPAGDDAVSLPGPAAVGRESLAAVAGDDLPGGADDEGPLPDYPRGSVKGRLVTVDGLPLPPGLTVAASLRRPYPRIEHITMTQEPRQRDLDDPHEIGSDRLQRVTATPVRSNGAFTIHDVPETGAWLAVQDDRLYPMEPVLLEVDGQIEGADDDDGFLVPQVRGARLVGRVQGTSGEPLEDAALEGRSQLDPFAIFDSGMTIVTLAPTFTDAAGRFLVGPVPVAEAMSVSAGLKGYELAVADVPPLASGDDHALTFTLTKGASISGKVIDEQDQPVAGARVRIMPTELNMADFDMMGRTLEVTDRTDDAGAFRFESLSAGGWRVRLASANYVPVASEPVEVLTGQTVKGIVLRAERGLSVSGRVVDADGAPIASARVEAALQPSMISMQANMDRQLREWVDTDDQGRFTVSGYEEGALRVWARAEGYVPAHVDAAAGDTDVVVALGHRTSLSGIAIRLEDAEPLEDYLLSFVPAEGLFDLTKMFEMDTRMANLPPPTRIEDDEGRFLIEDVTPGNYDITLRAEGYADTVLEDVAATADEATTGLVFLVPEEGRITGLVLSARDGQPVEGATVTTGRTDMLSRMSNTFTGAGGRATTDAEGRFVLDGLGTEPVSVTVSHATHMELGLPEVAPRPGEEPDIGVVTLPTGAAVWGVVRNADNRPLPGVNVMVSDNMGTTFKRDKTNAEGGYRIDGLRAGTYNIVRMDFTLDADADTTTSYLDSMVTRTVELEENEEKRVDLEPVQAGGVRLEGTIRSGGEPEAEAMIWVMAEESGSGLRIGTSDADGHYSIGGLEPGPYLVQVLPSGDVGVGSGSQPVAPVVSTVTLDDVTVHRHDIVVPGGVLRGKVVDERTNEGAGGVRVLLERKDEGLPVSRILAATGGRVGEVYSEADGSFRFRHLASGTYEILAGGTNILGLGETGWAQTRVADLAVNQSRTGLEVEIELRQGGAIAGIVTNEKGDPLAGVPVWARDDRAGRWLSLLAEVTTDASGRYTVNSLGPGPWTLAFGGRRSALTIGPTRNVNRGRITDLDMRLDRGVEIWVETGGRDPRGLTTQITTARGYLPLHLTSLEELMGDRPPPDRIRLGRVAHGAYDVLVLEGATPLIQETIHISGSEPRRVLSLEE